MNLILQVKSCDCLNRLLTGLLNGILTAHPSSESEPTSYIHPARKQNQ